MTAKEEYHKSPTAWIPVARNVKRFACLDSEDNVICKNHKTISGMSNCRKGKYTGAILKDGKLIRISLKRISASNGERAVLPYPTRLEDYNAAINCREVPE